MNEASAAIVAAEPIIAVMIHVPETPSALDWYQRLLVGATRRRLPPPHDRVEVLQIGANVFEALVPMRGSAAGALGVGERGTGAGRWRRVSSAPFRPEMGPMSDQEGFMGRFVIAAYRPKTGREQQLLDTVRRHAGVLRAEGLISERPAHAMRAADGTIVEVFEWLSNAAIERAHSNPAVQALWAEFGEACDYVPVGSLGEAQTIFSEFEALPV